MCTRRRTGVARWLAAGTILKWPWLEEIPVTWSWKCMSNFSSLHLVALLLPAGVEGTLQKSQSANIQLVTMPCNCWENLLSQNINTFFQFLRKIHFTHNLSFSVPTNNNLHRLYMAIKEDTRRDLLVCTKYLFQGRHWELVGPLNVCKYVRWSTNCITAITGCWILTTKAYKINIQFLNICIRLTWPDAVISQTWIQQQNL